MLRIKIETSLSGPDINWQPGMEVEVDDEEAQRLIDRGYASEPSIPDPPKDEDSKDESQVEDETPSTDETPDDETTKDEAPAPVETTSAPPAPENTSARKPRNKPRKSK